MIDQSDLLGGASIEIILPMAGKYLQFIYLKGWDWQILKLEVPFLKKLMENYMTIPPPEEIIKNKKLIKKLTDINTQLTKRTENGFLYIFMEDKEWGNVYIGQATQLSKITDWNFNEQGWNTFTEIYIFSLKNQSLTLSLRTPIEAKLYKFVMGSKSFKLLNDKADMEDIIRYTEYQLNDPEVKAIFENIKKFFKIYDISLLD